MGKRRKQQSPASSPSLLILTEKLFHTVEQSCHLCIEARFPSITILKFNESQNNEIELYNFYFISQFWNKLLGDDRYWSVSQYHCVWQAHSIEGQEKRKMIDRALDATIIHEIFAFDDLKMQKLKEIIFKYHLTTYWR